MTRYTHQIQFRGYRPAYISSPLSADTNPFECDDLDAVNESIEAALMSDPGDDGWHHGECDGEEYQICDPFAWDLSDAEVERRDAAERCS